MHRELLRLDQAGINGAIPRNESPYAVSGPLQQRIRGRQRRVAQG